MPELIIEWRHYVEAGETCTRCSATGNTLEDVIRDLRNELNTHGVQVVFIETDLPKEELSQSNLILFNGVPIEELLEGAAASENACCSCSCLTGEDAFCRTVEYDGKSYEDIPPELIRKAAYEALRRAESLTPGPSCNA
jgi:hypothetical protein